MEDNKEFTDGKDNINSVSENTTEKTAEKIVNDQQETVAEAGQDTQTQETDRYAKYADQTSDRYARYAEQTSAGSDPAAEPAGVAWTGSSYSGRPARDSEYSTYNHEYGRQAEEHSSGNPVSDRYNEDLNPAPANDQEESRPEVHYEDRSAGSGNSEAGSYSSTQGYTYYGSRPGYSQVSAPVMKKVKEKKPMPRFVAAALMAILFGVIAAGTFYGSSLVIRQIAENMQNEERSADEGAVTAAVEAKEVSGEADKLQITKLADIVDTEPTNVSTAVEKVLPSMVQINCTFITNSWFGSYKSSGAGSGIIIGKTDTQLLIATNNHVVENALSISVTFMDDTTADALTKGTDAAADLAVVAVDLDKLSEDTLNTVKVATIGDSNTVKVGQMAIAIGNAMGYGQSTTVGYISQKEHEVTLDDQKMILLQTDAAINPGNSGGALINLDGEVIGIPSVKFASSNIEGMGFAIPISRAITILMDLGSREVLADADKGYLGIYMQTVTQTTADLYNWPVGVYIPEVVKGCAAEKAGILVGDIITAFNGTPVTDSTTLKNYITSCRYGTKVNLTIARQEKGEFKTYEFEVELGQNPDYIKDDAAKALEDTPTQKN